MSIIGKITNRGLEINKNDLVSSYGTNGVKKILKKFTIKYKSPIGTYFLEKKNYIVIDGIIILPRFASEKLLQCKIINEIENNIKPGLDIECDYIGEPTYNQQIIADHLMKNIYNEEMQKKGLSGVTLKFLAGGGKSYLGMYLISLLHKKTLIVVPTEYLLKQWYDILSKFFPYVKIGQYYGKIKEDGDIMIGLINSLIKDEFIFKWTEEEIVYNSRGHERIKKQKYEQIKSVNNFYDEFGFIILDESHKYCSDTFKQIHKVCQSTYMLGLSATPNDDINGMDIISHLNIGEVLDAETIEGFNKDNTKFEAIVDIIKYNGPANYTKMHVNDKNGMVCVPMIIEDIINDPYRNKLILDAIYELYEQKLNIFVFSERRSHLEYLYEQFNYMLDDKDENYNISIPESDNIVLYGNSSNNDVESAKNKSSLIFTTFAYSSTGVSINRMTAMVLASPRKNKSDQIIGRIFRLADENRDEKRIIVDIVDNKSVLKNQLYTRIKAYKRREAVIIKREINYKDIDFD